MKLTWMVLSHTQELRRLRSSHRATDSSSQTDTVSSFLLKVDFLTSDVPLDIHPSSCPAHSPTRLLLKLIFGRTGPPTSTRRVKYTNCQRSLMRRLPDFTCQLLQLSLTSSLRIKPNILTFLR